MAAASSSLLNHGLIDGKEYQLKLGTSFQSKKATESYHLLRYDFKPASVDTSRPAEVTIGTNNECTVTIPSLHDSGSTTYKGGKKPCTKECILIIDQETGEITLERISSNIPVKKSRANRTTNSSFNKTLAKPVVLSSNKTTKDPKAAINSQNGPSASVPNSSQNNSQNAMLANNPSNQVKSSTQGSLSQTPVTKVKQREVSTTSTSDSNTSSSDSSDSESEEMAAHLESETFSTKAYEPPPPPMTSTKPTKSGSFSTLQKDLLLSDSNSDSD